MHASKGFTLIEIIVVLIIVGILAICAVPSYINSVQHGAATAAQNNLTAIYNAEKSYYFTHNAYCINTTNPNPCDNLTDINTGLSLNILDTNFSYICATDASGFKCTATDLSDATLILTLINSPIVLPGATPPFNPSCSANSNCPS